MNNLALSITMFSQGVPFFHAGDDILRSKSFDPNSYNSGDWFNKLDWTYESNNFGVGLPLEGTGQWDIYKPLLADPKLVPTKTDILSASAVFNELLQIRKSSKLFRLETADAIQRDLTFLNTGPNQIPGLIVTRLQDNANLDSNYQEIVVLFNAQPNTVTFNDAALTGNYVLHPVQQNSADAVVKQASFENNTFTVPGRTTAAFVIEKAEPIPTATTISAAEPTATDTPDTAPNKSLTITGVIAAILALLGLGIFLRRKKA
jgi:pullulanase